MTLQILLKSVILIYTTVALVFAQNGLNKQWVVIFSAIKPPPHCQFTSDDITSQCALNASEEFSHTRYSPIGINSSQNPEDFSDDRKDILVITDTSDYFIRGNKGIDTLVVWMRYRTGFTHSRVLIPFSRKDMLSLPKIVAHKVYATAYDEFLGEVRFSGGPTGMTITISDNITCKVPETILIPPGRYYIQASRPDFISRNDSLDVFPGKIHDKRILLLPQ
jgi:hypothetical protein